MILEKIRDLYVQARELAKTGNNSNSLIVINNITEISNYVKELYEQSTNMERIKCRAQYEGFDNVVNIIKVCGLKDERVRAFFGLAPSSAHAPSFSDILNGNVPPTPQNAGSNTAKPSANGVSVPVTKSKKPANQPKIGAVAAGSDSTFDDGKINPKYTPDSLDDFIGQERVVRELKREIKIAKTNGRHNLDNILLFGNPGLGKTTLMKLIAAELGAEYEPFDCSQMGNTQQTLKKMQSFLIRVSKINKPVVIAFDEIHMLSRELQSALLTLLNDRVFVSPPDLNGNIKRIPIENFTFIGATTNDEGVLPTIKNRCLGLTFQLVDYTNDELKRIYRNKVASKGLTISDDAIEVCIPRSRGAIRYVNSFVDGLDKALYNDDGMRTSFHIDLDVALAYFEKKGIDPMGLTDKDLEILHTLEETDGMGVDVLAARVGLDSKKYQSEYEKYLIKIGFIDVNGKGRTLTDRALRYLNATGGDDDGEVAPDYPDTTDNNGGYDDSTIDTTPETAEQDQPETSSDNYAPKDIIDDLFGD